MYVCACVCVCACLSVCLSVQATTFELVNIETSTHPGQVFLYQVHWVKVIIEILDGRPKPHDCKIRIICGFQKKNIQTLQILMKTVDFGLKLENWHLSFSPE